MVWENLTFAVNKHSGKPVSLEILQSKLVLQERTYKIEVSPQGRRVIGVSCHILPSLNKVSYLLNNTYLSLGDRKIILLTK